MHGRSLAEHFVHILTLYPYFGSLSDKVNTSCIYYTYIYCYFVPTMYQLLCIVIDYIISSGCNFCCIFDLLLHVLYTLELEIDNVDLMHLAIQVRTVQSRLYV